MRRIALSILLTLIAALGITAMLGLRDDALAPSVKPVGTPREIVARGEYLARAGDCMACHTARGGAEYAGGRAIRTPFGTVYAPNITPDRQTGIGNWSADDFWRALHNGKSKDGRLLYPAFPFPNYTKVSRVDADAMYAYFQSLRPVWQQNREHELRFPFNQRILLAGWRALYFRPGEFQPDPKQPAAWNRGAYLVQGLGHCNACHTPRNIFGATASTGDLSGAMIPMLGWYASSLTGEKDAGLGSWNVSQLTALLKIGVAERGAVSGPMAEVVRQSLQHLSDTDVHAMAVYLKSLPQGRDGGQQEAQDVQVPDADDWRALQLGASLYEKHCVECHKASGQGDPPGYPPLAGNRAVTLSSPVNTIRLVLHGGYPPSTQGNPQPFGMPPFGTQLNDEEAAAVLSYIRNAWGNHASMVSAGQVNQYRAVPLD